MTDTRKQIIELIKPYSKKTLSEGCLIKFEHNGITTFDTFIGDFGKYFDCIYEKEIYYEKEPWEKIGHYCITAVLKCIGKQKILGHYDYDEGYFEFFNDDGTLFCKIKDIPLHLYTEEEDQNLLTLLQKLGTKHK